jgi:DNA-binding transcriptional LysR family regulator
MAYADQLEGITVFAAVVDAGGFSAAGRALRCSKAAVSTQLRRLEDRLGVRLLQRTTRRLSLTEEGRAYYQHCRRILDEARDAADALQSLDAEPRGALRVNAPMSFGKLHLGAAIADFMTRHPSISVDLVLNDRLVDLIEDGFDMAIRISRLADSSLIVRRLAPCRRVVVASPDYWARKGRPARPEDLRRHEALIYDYQAEADAWTFKDNESGARISVPVKGRYRANNGEVLLDAATRGLGVVLSPTFFFGDVLKSGALETALTDYEDDPLAVYAVYPHRRHLATRVRAFVDFLAERFGDRPYWDDGCPAADSIAASR